jgi:hypothetical protein
MHELLTENYFLKQYPYEQITAVGVDDLQRLEGHLPRGDVPSD